MARSKSKIRYENSTQHHHSLVWKRRDHDHALLLTVTSGDGTIRSDKSNLALWHRRFFPARWCALRHAYERQVSLRGEPIANHDPVLNLLAYRSR